MVEVGILVQKFGTVILGYRNDEHVRCRDREAATATGPGNFPRQLPDFTVNIKRWEVVGEACDLPPLVLSTRTVPELEKNQRAGDCITGKEGVLDLRLRV